MQEILHLQRRIISQLKCDLWSRVIESNSLKVFLNKSCVLEDHRKHKILQKFLYLLLLGKGYFAHSRAGTPSIFNNYFFFATPFCLINKVCSAPVCLPVRATLLSFPCKACIPCSSVLSSTAYLSA